MMNSDTARVVIVYGAETRLGSAIVSQLQELEHSCVLRASDFFTKDVVRSIHRDIRAKKPAVVINCMVDPDCGFFPINAMDRLIAPSHAMLQQCRISGVRYIVCSSARVYGQQESGDLRGYCEYDPWMAYGDDQWRSVVQSLDASLWQQTSSMSLQARAETHRNFEYYCLRLGHLLHVSDIQQRPPDAYSLGHCVIAAIRGTQSFVCGRPKQRLSPIATTYAARAIAELCKPRPRPVAGTYNIASVDSTTVEDVFNYISFKAGRSTCVGSMCAGDDSAMQIYGVDADQNLDVSFWQERGVTPLPTWQQSVDKVIRRLTSSTIA